MRAAKGWALVCGLATAALGGCTETTNVFEPATGVGGDVGAASTAIATASSGASSAASSGSGGGGGAVGASSVSVASSAASVGSGGAGGEELDGGQDADAAKPCDGGAQCGGVCVDLDSDVKHCGGCNKPCKSPLNATATCSAGVCVYACVPPYGSCFGNPALNPENGCPSDLTMDKNNCGMCFTSCNNGCNNGKCF